MGIESVVNVQIDAQTQGVTQAGFGTPLVLAHHSHWPDRVRYYTKAEDMIADGFGADDSAVRAVRAVLSQNPKVSRVGVGRRDSAADMSHTVEVVGDTGVYAVIVDGKRLEVEAQVDATAKSIAAGLVAAIEAGSDVSATVGGVGKEHVITLTSAADYTLEVDVKSSLRSARLLVTETTEAGDIAGDIAAVLEADSDWYGLVLPRHGKAEILAAAAAIEATRKMLAVTTGDSAVLDTESEDDVASELRMMGYARTALMYSRRPYEQAAAAWFGVMFPRPPGSASWKFKALRGVSTMRLTTTEQNTLEGKRCNYYVEIAGVACTGPGYSPSGEWLDVTHGIDWLQARIQEGVFGLLARIPKVPFTDGGIALIEAELYSRLGSGVGAGLLAETPAPTVTVPRAREVSANDRAARVLPDVRFSAALAGAVHAVEINGTVTV